MNGNAILRGIQKVTGDWTKQRKREERAQTARLNRRAALCRERGTTIRDAAFEFMQEAYLKASAGGTLPAHARQIMYAARGYILSETNRSSLNDAYFTQTLLPQYIDENPEAREWDVVYDARGHFQEPHALRGEEVALGTLDVRRYLNDIQDHRVCPPDASVTDGDRYPTRGPKHRYGAVLFIEKEGFMPLFEKVDLAARYDLALMSTKGFSNVASRHLIDVLCGEHDIPLLVLHDFDVSGFMILDTLRMGTDRYVFEHDIQVIDAGLRLADVEQYGLEGEAAHHRRAFSTAGMTEPEVAYLRTQRVELNAFASDALVAFVESKLMEHGVEKVVPDADALAAAYRRAVQVDHLERAIRDLSGVARRTAKRASIPKDLESRVTAMLRQSPALSWDGAIRRIVKNDG